MNVCVEPIIGGAKRRVAGIRMSTDSPLFVASNCNLSRVSIPPRFPGNVTLTAVVGVGEEIWKQLARQVNAIAENHAKLASSESPPLSDEVVKGAHRLIWKWQQRCELPPTLVTGTCDATIAFEWHNYNGKGGFRSVDVTGEHNLEEYTLRPDGTDDLQHAEF